MLVAPHVLAVVLLEVVLVLGTVVMQRKGEKERAEGCGVSKRPSFFGSEPSS